MTTEPSTRPIARPALEAAAQAAARQIPPLWPLASSVAVNPFLGQATSTLAATGARLARVGGIAATMSRGWYRERLERGEISDVDLSAALGACPHDGAPRDIAALRAAVSVDRTPPMALPTIAELVRDSEGTDWPGAIADRIGVWAAGYFDRGQALWAAPRGRSAWTSWKAYAAHDLTPEIMGLDGFGPYVVYAPESAAEAVTRAVDRLGLDEASLDTYFHQLLLSLGGWAQFARYELWRAELENQTNSTITDLLAIRLLWEEALFDRNELAIDEEWTAVRKAHAAPLAPSEDDIIGEILQEAAERAGQRGLAQTLAKAGPTISPYRPALQVAFCIDVRSEVFRRALEAIDPSIRTLGFAGFFGVFTKHRRFASDAEELRLPVLLNPIVTSSAGGKDGSLADLSARYTARAKRAWGRFKLAAVSSFAFVEAAGPIYVVKLLRDALGFNPAPPPDDDAPRFDPELDLETRIGAAETVLRAMSLTEDFARLILLAGHGANGVNNPFKSGLHCGACGGYSGDVNARLLAGLLNDADVRGGLVARGITVPDHTLFVGALHDTTTDRVTLYDCDVAAEGHIADLKQARQWLEAAGKVTCTERALRLPGTKGVGDISVRSRNWAEVRPEWALAGCQAFIAAPRGRTTGRSLEGRAFLHDYDWRQDSAKGFAVLELIMTAPVVVASWISLQYYGSTVAPATFGAGNKLLHNVVGGIGVFEGNGGQMRAGLPWQSVHDGERHMHDPLRLSVCIEAPRDAMSEILRQHPDVRALFDNRWLHLFAIDDHGRLAYRYLGNLQWEAVAASTDHQPLRNVA